MARAENQELIERFEQFYRRYYGEDVGELARKFPDDRKSLYVDWLDLFQFDPDIAEDFISQPGQMREYAEEALRLYDLPVDVSLGGAHVRLRDLDGRTDIRDIRSHHVNTLVSVTGMIRKATDVRPKITEAAFECQRCGTLNIIPQSGGGFQEPHECQGCERQGPFEVNFDQSEFVDAQKLRVQESPEGLRGGETPQSIDINIEDDVTGEVTPGDHVTVTGVLRLQQQERGGEKTAMFDVYMEGWTVEVEDEEFEDMEITDEDKEQIVTLSQQPDIYETMVESVAPSIYGFEDEKLSMILQLFAGVTKHLPDGSRTRGDIHMLLIGDPGTGKCVAGDTTVSLANGRSEEIRTLVESNLDDPKPVDDGVYDDIDLKVPSLLPDGRIGTQRATRVWKREAPDHLYQIRTNTGQEIEVTPSHPLYIRSETGHESIPARDLTAGDYIATPRGEASDVRAGEALRGTSTADGDRPRSRTDGGLSTMSTAQAGTGLLGEDEVRPPRDRVEGDIRWVEIESIDAVDPEEEWVYDIEVQGTHNYLSNGIVSHNSALLQYIGNIAPRSVYTSGKGSSAAGLTAAAVRDDFGDGQQWSLEAGALVLADKGMAAVDELDKMEPGDRSALHEALEQQTISISKAGINATLKARCSLLGAANPKYGRFDQYEPIGEQIDLEPALISRFDLIFTVSDQPNAEEDRELAEHILQTNYAGELSTHRTQLPTANVTEEEVEAEVKDVSPAIDAELLRKYIAHAKSSIYPTMSDGARERIKEFYVDLRAEGEGEDQPVPVTARQLEALVRLAEASARVRLSDTVTEADAERVIEIVRACLRDIGVDPETGEFDADVIEVGQSKTQRDRAKSLRGLIGEIENEYEDGAPVEEVLDRAEEAGHERSKAEHEIEKLKQKGEVYQPSQGHLRTT